MMTCTKPLTAIILPCPCCGEAEAGINVRLDLLDEDDTQFECRNCGGEFGRNQVADFIKKWTKVLNWMDAAPDMDAAE